MDTGHNGRLPRTKKHGALGWASNLGDHSYDFRRTSTAGVVEALWGNYDDVRPDDVLDQDCCDFRTSA